MTPRTITPEVRERLRRRNRRRRLATDLTAWVLVLGGAVLLVAFWVAVIRLLWNAAGAIS